MRKVFGFVLLGGGLAAAWQFMQPGVELPQLGSTASRSSDIATGIAMSAAGSEPASGTTAPASPKPSAAKAPTAKASPVETVAARTETELTPATAPPARSEASRTFSPSSPLFAQIGQEPQLQTPPTVVAGRPAAAAAPRPQAVATVVTPAVTVTTQKAAVGEEAQRALVRDIQKELKRVGCYSGAADGQWTSSTSRAMGTYVGSSNASLPVDKPDVALLAMLKAEKAETGCSATCGKGQVSAGSGICVPRPVVASRGKAAGTATVAGAATNSTPSHPVAPARTASAQPLPGVMSVGGPKAEGGEADGAVSASLTNPQPQQQPPAVNGPAPIVRKLPPPVAATPPKREPRVARSSSGRDGTRAVRDIFEHPLGR